VVKSLVKPKQMTGSYKLFMLNDGGVKRYPTAVVELGTPYYRGTTKVLCMETPMQDIIIGNISGAHGTDVIFDAEHDHDLKHVSNTNDISMTEEVISEQNNLENKYSKTEDNGTSLKQVTSVQIRAMIVKEKNNQ